MRSVYPEISSCMQDNPVLLKKFRETDQRENRFNHSGGCIETYRRQARFTPAHDILVGFSGG